MQLRVRETSVLRCVYCHDDLGAGGVSCPCCSIKLHPECVTPKCPSLGCSHRFAALLLKIARRFNPAWRAQSWWFWFIGIAFPAAALCVNECLGGAFRPEAREELNSWRSLAFVPEVQRVFYPLFLCSFAAYAAWLYGRRGFLVRSGLAGGLLLGVAWTVLYAFTLPWALFAVVTGIGVVILAPFSTPFVYLGAVVAYHRERRPETAPDSIAGTLGFTSLWALAASMGTYAALERMNDLYAKLPERVSSGDCYLATVAARGDRRVTRARSIRLRDGRTLLVSRQLRRFKAFEIVLMAVAPGVHRALRAVYNRVGPPLAARMGPRAATVLHVLFKPLEAAIAVLLRGLFRNPDALLESTYRGS